MAECLGANVDGPITTSSIARTAVGAERHIVEPEPGIALPAFVLRPSGSESGRTVVYCCDEGKLAGLGVAFLSEVTLRGGLALAFDPRGFGETTPTPPPTQTVATLDGKLIYRPTGEGDTLEFEAATNTLMLGRSLFGQQVSDVISAVRYARQLTPQSSIHVVGSGPLAALLALYAGALCDEVSSVVAERLLPTYHLLVEEDAQVFPITAYVFDVLRVTDVPQIAALLAPRRLIIPRPIGACLQPIPIDQARQFLAWTMAAYELRGGAPPAVLGSVSSAELAEWVV